MTDWPVFIRDELTPTHLSTYGGNFAGGEFRTTMTANLAATSGAWPVADTAFFIPFAIPYHYVIERFFWANGATVGHNVDVGVYNLEGTKLCSTGSTVSSGASAIQYAAISGFSSWILPPGRYYFGHACGGTTTAVMTTTTITANAMRLGGVLQQATALPLPATMASAVAVTSAGYALAGFTRTDSGF